MLIFTHWQLAFMTVAILLAYEVALLWVQRRKPGLLARAALANLREEWFAALSKQPGSEILAIQTLRNSLMSATMTASTAALGLIGAATLLAPTLNSSLGADDAAAHNISARLAMELVLLGVLFVSLVCSAMAVRHYNHAGFITPCRSNQRRWLWLPHWLPLTVFPRKCATMFNCGCPAWVRLRQNFRKVTRTARIQRALPHRCRL